MLNKKNNIALLSILLLLAIGCMSEKESFEIDAMWERKIDYINFLEATNDSLFAVKISARGVMQKILLNKVSGVIMDTLYGEYKPTEDKYSEFRMTKIDLYGCKGVEKEKKGGPISTIKCRYFVFSNQNGDSVIIETKYRNVRSSNNVTHRILVVNDDIVKKSLDLDYFVYDYVVLDHCLVLYCSKTNEYEIISIPLNELID